VALCRIVCKSFAVFLTKTFRDRVHRLRLQLERNGELINFEDAREEKESSRMREKENLREARRESFKGKSWPVRLAVSALIEGAFPLR